MLVYLTTNQGQITLGHGGSPVTGIGFFPRTPEHELVQLLIRELSGNHASPSSKQPEGGMCVNWRPSTWPRRSPQVPEGMTSNKRIQSRLLRGMCIYISLTGNCVLLPKIRTLQGNVYFILLFEKMKTDEGVEGISRWTLFKYKIMVKLTPALQVD